MGVRRLTLAGKESAMAERRAAAMAPCGVRIVRWDGERLTVPGEPFFAIYAWTRVGIASAILCLVDSDASDAEALVFAEQVIRRFDVARGFVTYSDAAERWLRALRANKERQAQDRSSRAESCTSPPGRA